MKFQTKVSLFFSLGISTVILLLVGFIAVWVGQSKRQEIYDYQSSVADLITAQSAATIKGYLTGQAGYVHWDIFKPDGSALDAGGGGLNSTKSLQDTFLPDSFEKLKTAQSGRKSLVLEDKSHQSFLATLHVGPHYLMLASTPNSVYQRFLVVALLPIFILLVGLIGLSLIVGRSVSRVMTSDLNRLVGIFSTLNPEKATPIAEANFSTEFREMAVKTNQLQDRIQKFVVELKSKARIDSELEIAREVQKSLFPKSELTTEHFKVRSRFFSADECSGDWYFYSAREQTLWAVVGDVTGHGVSSAILASVCRGVWPAVESLPIEKPHLVLELFNDVISSLESSGKFMTMIVLAIDLKQKKYFVSSASHESPVIVRPSAQGPSVGDMIDTKLQPRIGSGVGIKYSTSSGDIEGGESFLLYSDGLFELSLPNGRRFNDLNLIRQLQKEDPMNWIPLLSSRVGKKLLDDISIVQVTINK